MLKKINNFIKKLLKKLNVFKLFAQCINGEASLFQAFWVVYILFGLIQLGIIELIFNHYHAGSYILLNVHNGLTDKFITYAFPYLFFSTMCVWVCAKNSWLEWKLSSRVVVAIPLIVASFHLTNIL